MFPGLFGGVLAQQFGSVWLLFFALLGRLVSLSFVLKVVYEEVLKRADPFLAGGPNGHSKKTAHFARVCQVS